MAFGVLALEIVKEFHQKYVYAGKLILFLFKSLVVRNKIKWAVLWFTFDTIISIEFDAFSW